MSSMLRNNTKEETVMEARQVLLSQLKLYQDKHKMKECLELIRNEATRELIASDCDLIWDLIPLVCSRLRGLNEFRFKTFQACVDMLLEISHICKPKEVLISLLAELENDSKTAHDTHDDNCFRAILKPLEYVLICLPTKRNETLKWVLNTLNAHILKLALPEEYELEGKERLLMDLSKDIKRINNTLPYYIKFITTFVKEVDVLSVAVNQSHNEMNHNENKKAALNSHKANSKNCSKVSPTNVYNKTSANPNIQRSILLKSLLNILNHPLVYMDLTSDSQSDSREIALQIVVLISKLQPNFYQLIERNDLISKYKDFDSMNDTDIKLDEQAFHLAMANLSYLIHCENSSPPNFLPWVYTHVYVLQTHLPFIETLIQRTESLICEKGLLLADVLLSRIGENHLEASFMEYLEKYQIEKPLIQVLIFSTVQSHRKLALKVFNKLVACFNNNGKYKMLYSILAQDGQHVGVKGYVIGLFKDIIGKNKSDPTLTGTNLHRMVKTAISVSLPDEVETDLLENNDTIFYTLNMMRFIFLNDPKQQNETKMWDIRDYVKDQFLAPLRRAIDLSKAHYQLELKKLTQEMIAKKKKKGGKNSPKKSGGIEFEAKIAGESGDGLPSLTPADQHQLFIHALQNFDILESVLVRLEEIINL